MLLLELIDDCQGEICRHLSYVEQRMLADTCREMKKLRPKVPASKILLSIIESGHPKFYYYFDQPEWSDIWKMVLNDPPNIAYFGGKLEFQALLELFKLNMIKAKVDRSFYEILMEFAFPNRTIAELKSIGESDIMYCLGSEYTRASFARLDTNSRISLRKLLDRCGTMEVNHHERTWVWKCRHAIKHELKDILSHEDIDFGLLQTIIFDNLPFFVESLEYLRTRNLQISPAQMNEYLLWSFREGRTEFVKYLLDSGAKIGSITWTPKNTKKSLMDLIPQNSKQIGVITGVPPFWPRNDIRLLKYNRILF